MTKPYVITINAVSGGGKTALAQLVHRALPRSMLFCFDEFEATNCYPADFYTWSQQGADPLAIDCPGMGAAVDHARNEAGLDYLVLDCPLGRDHPRFAAVTDLAVFIDTPLDVALARRILRDYPTAADATAANWQQLRTDLTHYLTKARYPYLAASRHKMTSDLILDGWRPLRALRDEVLGKIRAEQQKRRFSF